MSLIDALIHPCRTLAALVLAAALGACANSPPLATPPPGSALPPDFAALAEIQGPAVVNVVAAREVQPAGQALLEQLPEDDPHYELFKRLIPELTPEQSERVVQDVGTGFVIRADGLILTSAHVVADARRVTVRMADGAREYPGEVLGVDRRTDIALVRVGADDLPVARLGASRLVKSGEWVVAIGSPFGLDNTITAGIVSATGRALSEESLVPFIQTDVAVNPGNSGGPLLNARGEVIGVNSMILSRTGGFMGVSFAIPIEVALEVARQLESDGKVTRGRIGVVIQGMTPELGRAFGLEPPEGVAITAVAPDGPAARAGLRAGDVVLAFDGNAVDETNTLPQRVAAARPGSTATLDVWREGRRLRLPVTLGELPPDEPARAPAPRPLAVPAGPATDRLGLVLGDVPAEELARLGVGFGLRVEAVSGAAAQGAIRPNDVVVAVNQRQFDSRDGFEALLDQARPGGTVALLVRRDGAALFMPLEIPAASTR